jgi:hypothetical protein
MENSEGPSGNSLGDALPRLMGFARLAESLANRFKGVARFLAVSGLLAAVWLAYAAAHSFGFSPIAAAIAGVAMALPALVLGWIWFVLGEASAMPRRLADWLGRAHGYAGETWQSFQGEQKPGRSRIGDLKPLAGLAYELRSMGGDARDLALTLRGALSLTNPLFLLLVAASTLAIVLLDIASVATGLSYLIR